MLDRYRRVRAKTVELCRTLSPEDTVVQTMPDVSPSKWHLAHVTWFFEKFVLERKHRNYTPCHPQYHYLFNSYYHTAGDMHARPQRGLLSRPGYDEILAYRYYVDDAMAALLAGNPDHELLQLVTLGLNHEQQHQELLLTDIKHVFSCNPLLPAFDPELAIPASTAVAEHHYCNGVSGIQAIGANAAGFCFDNETPRHDALLPAHQIGSRLITNGEFLQFVNDGGYRDSRLWLSDGWTAVNEQGWNRPLYWNNTLDAEYTLGGLRDLDRNAAVAHVSYYEADAFARWAGARLPTEFEWEVAAADAEVTGNLLDSGLLHPAAGAGPQWFGDVWEWTSSPYTPYPGFVPLAGSLGEYNGKFMSQQMSVRGGSCVTANEHIRASYRSFFYPQQRWQFLGFRLAKDGHA